MPTDQAAFTHLIVSRENAIHRAPMAQIGVLVQQRGIHLARRMIHEAVAVEGCPYLRALLGGQRVRRCRMRFGLQAWLTLTIDATARHIQRLTRACNPDLGGEFVHDCSASVELSSRRASFFWASIIASARSSLLLRRVFSASSRRTSARLGLATGPRFLSVRVPLACAVRHLPICA